MTEGERERARGTKRKAIKNKTKSMYIFVKISDLHSMQLSLHSVILECDSCFSFGYLMPFCFSETPNILEENAYHHQVLNKRKKQNINNNNIENRKKAYTHSNEKENK